MEFAAAMYVANTLRNAGHVNLFRRHGHMNRIKQQLVGKFYGFLGKRRREKHRLSLIGQLGDDLSQIREEPHVKHAIRLVQDKDLNITKSDMFLVDQIQQSSRRCDQNVDACRHRVDLRALVHASVDNRHPKPHVFSIGSETITNLNCQFSGWRQDQCRRAVACSARPFMPDKIEDWQRKCGGFPSSRLGTTQDILAIDGSRDGL